MVPVTRKKRNIYEILELIKDWPALYLGNNYGITALNHFMTGYWMGQRTLYDKGTNYPNFSLFTDWLVGLQKYDYESTSSNWIWHFLKRYKDEKKALEKFFNYLQKFKSAQAEVMVIPINEDHIRYSIERESYHLWCKYGNSSRLYTTHLKKVNRIILFKLLPSNTLFSLLIDKNNRIIDQSNSDIANKTLRKKIEKQFGIQLPEWSPLNSIESRNILRTYNVM